MACRGEAAIPPPYSHPTSIFQDFPNPALPSYPSEYLVSTLYLLTEMPRGQDMALATVASVPLCLVQCLTQDKSSGEFGPHCIESGTALTWGQEMDADIFFFLVHSRIFSYSPLLILILFFNHHD